MSKVRWSPWVKNFVIWTAIGFMFLFFGGLAGHGYRMFMTSCAPAADCGSRTPDWLALGQLSIGGGVALGLIGLALTLASPRGIGTWLAIGVVGVLLFLIFIWPTPFWYYRDGSLLTRVNRITGEVTSSHVGNGTGAR